MPTSAQVSRYLQITLMVAALMYFTRVITIPMTFGLLTAIVLYPLCQWLEQRRLPRSWAIMVCLLLVFVIGGGLVSVMVWQVTELRQELPRLSDKSDKMLLDLQQWLTTQLGLTMDMQIAWLRQSATNLGGKLGSILLGTFIELPPTTYARAV
jgi:predicted PurR-regulated permease PerM